MQADPYTRAVLTVIAVALVLLVVRGFGSESAEGAGRYRVLNVRLGRGPAVLRVDSETGDVWRLQGQAGEVAWRLFETEEVEAEAALPAPRAPAATLPGGEGGKADRVVDPEPAGAGAP